MYGIQFIERGIETDVRLCGGLTVYAPMIRNGAGPGKKIGVVGLGGLYVNPQYLRQS
jgi:hypothetical protein